MRTTTPDARRLALAILCLGQLMIILDGTIVAVALPAIQADLGFSSESLAWVVNAYLVPFGGLLLLFGRVGDVVAPRHVFRVGLLVFTVTSCLCGLARNPTELLAARFAQGVGGAMTSAVTLAMVAGMFTEPRPRARAMGVYSFVQSAGGSLGLVVGGVLVQALDWHWIFLVNVPVGAVALAMSVPALGRTGTRPRTERARPDVPGAVLATIGLMLLVLAIVQAATAGWRSAPVVGGGAGAAIAVALFLVRQARAEDPLVPRRLLDRRTATALATLALLIAGMFAFQYVTVLYLHDVLRFDELSTGVAMLPVSLAIGATSLGAAAPLVGRYGPRTLLVPALGLVVAGLLWLAHVSADSTYGTAVLPALLALGVGFGAAMPALAGLAMSTSGPADAGVVSGLFNTMQQVGGALGLAAFGTAAAARTAAALRAGSAPDDALAAGYGLAFALAAGAVVAALVVALVGLDRRVPARSDPARTDAVEAGVP